jgi:cytolysin-activating lysine-acyltransferase
MAQSQPDAAPLDNTTVLGQVAWLMMNTPDYRHFFLADLEWMILPPILLRQFKLFRADNKPVAFAAWALLSEEAEARIQSGNARLQPAEWKGGDRLWLVHVIAPLGGAEAVVKDLRETALQGKSFKMHRRGADGRMAVEAVQG